MARRTTDFQTSRSEEELRFSLEVIRGAPSQRMLDAPLRSVVFGELRDAAGESEQDVVDRLFAATLSFNEAKWNCRSRDGRLLD